MPILTRRYDDAVAYAHGLHAAQTRKVTGAPYLGHLLGVSSIVIDDGGTEDEAIAALLHDAAEDQGGRDRLEEIRRKFGEAVAKIVEDCTDSWTTPKPPWPERKRKYIDHARTLGPSSLRVSAADKVHNAYAICGSGAKRSGTHSTPARTTFSRITRASCARTAKPAADTSSRSSIESSAASSGRWGTEC
jgi:(p)ppGpp synthase/HD superfamily hydrolase